MWNIKNREVECLRCRNTFVTDEKDPKFPIDGATCITIVKSMISGERFESQSIEEASKTSKQ